MPNSIDRELQRALFMIAPQPTDISHLSDEEKNTVGKFAAILAARSCVRLFDGQSIGDLSDEEIDNAFEERFSEIEPGLLMATSLLRATKEELVYSIVDDQDQAETLLHELDMTLYDTRNKENMIRFAKSLN